MSLEYWIRGFSWVYNCFDILKPWSFTFMHFISYTDVQIPCGINPTCAVGWNQPSVMKPSPIKCLDLNWAVCDEYWTFSPLLFRCLNTSNHQLYKKLSLYICFVSFCLSITSTSCCMLHGGWFHRGLKGALLPALSYPQKNVLWSLLALGVIITPGTGRENWRVS